MRDKEREQRIRVFSNIKRLFRRIKTKMSVKPIKTSLKEKKRYLVFKIISKTKIKEISLIFSEIKQKLASFMGQKNFAEAHIVFLKDSYDESNQKMVVKVNNKQLINFRTGLLMIDEISKQKIIIKTLGVSGILKKAKGKYFA